MDMNGRDAGDEAGVFSEAGATIGNYDVVRLRWGSVGLLQEDYTFARAKLRAYCGCLDEIGFFCSVLVLDIVVALKLIKT